MDKTDDVDDDFEIEFATDPVATSACASDGLILFNATSNTREQQIQVDRGKLVTVKILRLILALHTFKALREQP